MGTIVSFINRKGGVGKTTISVNIAGYLAGRFNKKVLFIDIDPQANASIWILTENIFIENIQKSEEGEKSTVFQIFMDAIRDTDFFDKEKGIIRDAVRDERGVPVLPGLDLLPSHPGLDQLEHYIVNYSDVKASILYEALIDMKIPDDYDYIIIDCPPNMGTASQNALFCSDYFIIPLIPDILSLQGFPELMNTAYKVIKIAKKRRLDGNIPKFGGLIISHFRNINAHKNTIKRLEDLLEIFKKERRFEGNFKIFNQKIKLAAAIAEAQADKKLIYTTRKKSNSKIEFETLTSEFLEKVGGKVI